MAGVCLAGVALSVAGCWDRTEVDDIAFIMAIGLDEAPANQVYVTFHIAVPRAVAGGGVGSRAETQQNSLVTTVMGRSILGVVNLVNTHVDRRPSLVHGKMVVIGEALARLGVAPYISELVRFRETRRTMFLVVAKGTAKKFIENNRPVIEQNPAKHLELLALTTRQTGLVPPSQLHRFLVEMQSLGEEPLVILAGVREERQGGSQNNIEGGLPEETPGFPGPPPRPARTDDDYTAGTSPRVGGNPAELLGGAVFRGDRMVGEITGEEARAVLLLRGSFKRGTAVSKDPFVEKRYVSYDLRLAQPTQVKITRRGQNFHVKVKVMLEGEVIGAQTRVDYSNPKNLRALEKQLAADLEKLFKDTIGKAQTEFKADIFAFGNKARHMTTTWRQWVDLDWPKEFPKASIDASVKVNLRRTGLLFKPAAPPPWRTPNSDER